MRPKKGAGQVPQSPWRLLSAGEHRSRRGAPGQGFDFSHHMRQVCRDMVTRLDELAHIDLSAVAIGFAQARHGRPHGIQATLTPMRFQGGALTTVRDGQRMTVQRFFDGHGTEMLYLLSFSLPRFLDCPLAEKLVIILHELWHISPRFDGDLRRFGGRCYAHGSSRARFDAVAEQLAQRWLDQSPPNAVYGFLGGNFRQLVNRYGRVHAMRIPTPRLIPVPPSVVGARDRR